MIKDKILQNAIRVISDDKIYYSRNVHDFVPFHYGDGAEGFIDGGTEYFRTSFVKHNDIELLFLTTQDSLETRIDRALWGTYGKEGTPRHFRWVFLKDCETEHLQAILKTQPQVKGVWIEEVIKAILVKRDLTP